VLAAHRAIGEVDQTHLVPHCRIHRFQALSKMGSPATASSPRARNPSDFAQAFEFNEKHLA
jgi:hypothetical protein